MGLLTETELLLRGKNYSGSGNWLDESGNGHHAVPYGTPTFTTDHFTFVSASHQYFRVADHADLDFANGEAFTLMVVFSRAGVPGGNEFLIQKGAAFQGYGIYTPATAYANFRIGDGTVTPFIECSAVPNLIVNNQKHVLAGVRHIVDDKLYGYMDGIVRPGGGATDTTTVTLANAVDFTIGANNAGANLWFAGNIYDVALWRRALTDGEVDTANDELTLQTVPDVVGLTAAAAQAAIEAEVLVYAEGTPTPVIDVGQDGLVQSQNPAADTLIIWGSTVTVSLGVFSGNRIGGTGATRRRGGWPR